MGGISYMGYEPINILLLQYFFFLVRGGRRNRFQ